MRKKKVYKVNSHIHKPRAPQKQASIEGIISTTSKGLGFIDNPQGSADSTGKPVLRTRESSSKRYPKESERTNIRIEAGFLNTALHGDTVQVILHPKTFGSQPTGEVVKIVKRKRTRFVGTIEKEDGIVFVAPDDRHFYTDFLVSEAPANLQQGDKVFIELTQWNNSAKNPLARIIEVIGKKGVHNVEIRSIILEKGIDDTFPAAVKKEADEINTTRHTIALDANSSRRDFRMTPTCTIDPVDAKDFDDALSYEQLPNGDHAVGVHIADVSHYVRPGTALDAEALHRAFSVYLVDRTIPMLPEILSNDLCSLNPDTDRFAFSAWFVINSHGKVTERWFGKSIIHSHKRFSYEEAQEVLNAKNGPFLTELENLNALAKIFRRERTQRGSIDFEQHEVRFELNADGVPIDVYLKARLDTHKLVEEFMLLANREVAEFIAREFGKNKRHSFIYRIHDTPNKEKITELATFVKALGHTLHISPRGDVDGKALNELFDAVTGTPEEALIKTTALRSMAKAKYSALNIGHFGLAMEHYTHFTSPIRRYADLTVHRLLQEALTKNHLPNDKWIYYQRVADDISARELTVIEAERESVKFKQVEFLSGKIGQTFEGVISGVSEWGIFVQEKESRAEGLIRINTMADDYYVLEPKKYRLIGQKTKKTYSLGDTLQVKLMHADVDKKTIDFVLV